jgi:hypothetical protein
MSLGKTEKFLLKALPQQSVVVQVTKVVTHGVK